MENAKRAIEQKKAQLGITVSIVYNILNNLVRKE